MHYHFLLLSFRRLRYRFLSRQFPSPACRIALVGLGVAPTAQAHVKWFSPFSVSDKPQGLEQIWSSPWFWLAIALSGTFFLTTLVAQRTSGAHAFLNRVDGMTAPLWLRLDEFMRTVICTFFFALFSAGGVYLTPELTTESAWVPWLQLAIAACVFLRRTRRLSAIGVVLLWCVAVRAYDIFHLIDYLPLMLGVAGYLWLDASDRPERRDRRFLVLRWGLALALMWSSLEKFAYPSWFHPIIEDRPYLTFGIAREAFIQMAGITEFTMGFGLLWAPLVRRLSAMVLFVIFSAAVAVFGRIDLLGHTLILAVLVVTVVDRTPSNWEWRRRQLWAAPAALAAAFSAFSGSYWGLHTALYDTAEGRPIVAQDSTSPAGPGNQETPNTATVSMIAVAEQRVQKHVHTHADGRPHMHGPPELPVPQPTSNDTR